MKIHKSILGRIYDALRGIYIYFREELKFHEYIFVILFFTSVICLVKPNFLETLFILLMLAISIFIGFFNNIVEKICDLYSRENNPLVRDIKDLAAGATSLYIVLCVIILFLIYFN